MVLNESYFQVIGPVINSGGPILFFGEPGNGKTMIAEKIIEAFDNYIYVPHCLMVDGQFIKYFDEKVHIALNEEVVDPRWVKVKRPFIVVGGELTLPMLDLVYKEEFKYYEAPLQLKANGGVLLIDDFGRQLVSPKELLNRWIYPLEKRVDYLTLVTGKKIEVPFNQMLLFSSNLTPKKLGDDAFKYLVTKYFTKQKREFRGCHPRDLLSHITDYNSYYKKPATLTKENIDFACKSYFAKFQSKKTA